MNSSKNVVKKRLLLNKSRLIVMVAVFSLLIATLFTVVSVSFAFGEKFVHTAREIGEKPGELLSEGAMNVLKFAEYLAHQFNMQDGKNEYQEKEVEETKEERKQRIERAPQITQNKGEFERSGEDAKKFPKSYQMFSARAGLVNLPIYIIACCLAVLLVVRATVSIVFSVYKNERRRFFTTLMISGASGRFIKSAAVYEGLYLFAAAVPFGLLFGAAEIICTDIALNNAFRKICDGISENPENIDIRINIAAALIALLFVMLSVISVSGKACRKLYMKNASAELRNNFSANIGNRVFSAEGKAYKRHGIERYVAMRCFSGEVNRYLRVFFIASVCIGLSGLSLMIFTVSKNYNNVYVNENSGQILLAGLTSHTFACAISFLLILPMLICLFFIITSSIESNINMYMMMHALGLNFKKIQKCASVEIIVCVIIGIVSSGFSVFWLWNFIMENYYLYERNISFHGGGIILTVVGMQLVLYIAVSFIASVYAKKKIRSTDLIKALKDFSY